MLTTRIELHARLLWRMRCGCVAADLTEPGVVIVQPRRGRGAWRVPRPLPAPLVFYCEHGIEHRLTEEDAQRWERAA